MLLLSCCRLSDSGRRRQLLGLNDGKDGCWGPLLGRAQLLLQLAEGALVLGRMRSRGCRSRPCLTRSRVL